MAEPAAQADHRLGVPEEDFAALTQAFVDLRGQPGCVQEDAATDFGMIAIEAIPNNVYRRDAGANVGGIPGDAANLPAVLHFQLQFVAAEAKGFLHSLFQVALAGADQQHVVHVPQIMLNPVRPLSPAQLAHVLLDVMVEGLQKEIGEPLAGVCPDGNASRNATDHGVDHIQQTGVFDDSPEGCFQQFLIDVLIKLADVQFDEVLCLFIMGHPLPHSLSRGVDTALRY